MKSERLTKQRLENLIEAMELSLEDILKKENPSKDSIRVYKNGIKHLKKQLKKGGKDDKKTA